MKLNLKQILEEYGIEHTTCNFCSSKTPIPMICVRCMSNNLEHAADGYYCPDCGITFVKTIWPDDAKELLNLIEKYKHKWI